MSYYCRSGWARSRVYLHLVDGWGTGKQMEVTGRRRSDVCNLMKLDLREFGEMKVYKVAAFSRRYRTQTVANVM